MKKFAFFLAPLMAISFLTNCGGKTDPTPPGPKLYTVTFDTGEGGSVVHPQMVIENQYAAEPPNPTRTESYDAVYTFKEWQLEGKKFDFTTQINSDITLKAEWNVINKFTVTFDTGEGGSEVPIQKVAPNKCATKPDDPTKVKEGYTCSFLYWELDNKEFKFDTPINKNITLTAKWQETIKQYTVSVTSEDEAKGTVNGGGSYDSGSSVTIEATPKTGYSFEGWYKDGEKVPSASASYSFNMPASDVSYEARFIVNKYTVTLTVSSRLATSSSEGGTVAGKGTYTYGDKVAIEAIPKTGYKFNGWYDGKTFISDEPTYNFNMPAKNITYTAKFANENAWFFKSDWWTYCSNDNDREQAIKDDVGQEVNLTVNNQVHKVRLIDINHDVLNDDSSKTAHCTFEFVNLLSDKDGYSITTLWNISNGKGSTNYDYLNSDLRKALDGSGNGTLRWYQKGSGTKSKTYTEPVIDMLPDELKSQLKEVKKYVATTSSYTVNNYPARVFALTHREMTTESDYYTEKEGSTYQYYIDHDNNSSRIKHQIKWHDGAVTSRTKITDHDITWTAYSYAGYNEDERDSYGGYYWLTSPCIRYDNIALGVLFNGDNIRDHVYDVTSAVAPAFCI